MISAKTQSPLDLDYTAKHADNTGLLGALNDRPYVKSWAQYKWSINVSYRLSRLSWIIYIFSIHTASFIMLNLSPLLFTGRPHALSATLSCDFSVSVQVYFQGFLSKPLSISPSGRDFLKSCISSSTGVCAPSPWDSWSQLSTFSRLISHKAPFHTSCLTWRACCSPLFWCTVCSPLSTGAAPPMLSVFCILPPLLLPTFSFHSQGPPLPQFEIHCLYFPHFFPKDLQILFYQHIICLSLSFFPETLLGG